MAVVVQAPDVPTLSYGPASLAGLDPLLHEGVGVVAMHGLVTVRSIFFVLHLQMNKQFVVCRRKLPFCETVLMQCVTEEGPHRALSETLLLFFLLLLLPFVYNKRLSYGKYMVGLCERETEAPVQRSA